MENQTKGNREPNENEMDANAADNRVKENPVDDAFKTANRKHKLEWQQPQDEQMFDRMDSEEE
ncbi:hypothetical protein [Desertivirga xinjiangensis]|uniref:hypothetical protein n=1 Tax=Desertivirga xinjiangensis TaxID=539206 RepID=UPI0021094310|nr:hypothetical protein [Pedobacter xinjiangensis]